jgi:N-methylhydantoinase B
VPTGGHNNIPSGGISDVERIEMQYPFLYFTRNHNPDGGGFGQFNGGNGSHRVVLAYGSTDLSVDFKPYGGIPQGAVGLFGGYPAGTGGYRAVFEAENVLDRLAAGEAYPTNPDAILEDDWGKTWLPDGHPGRVHIAEGWLVTDFVQGGGGYGDPLDRSVDAVVRDIREGLITRRAADLIYGVCVGPDGGADLETTSQRRQQIRDERRRESRRPTHPTRTLDNVGRVILEVHPTLHVVEAPEGERFRCVRCACDLGPRTGNYKTYALRRDRDMQALSGRALPSGEAYIGVIREYACPGCATLLQVDVFCPQVGGEEDWWDIRV